MSQGYSLVVSIDQCYCAYRYCLFNLWVLTKQVTATLRSNVKCTRKTELLRNRSNVKCQKQVEHITRAIEMEQGLQVLVRSWNQQQFAASFRVPTFVVSVCAMIAARIACDTVPSRRRSAPLRDYVSCLDRHYL